MVVKSFGIHIALISKRCLTDTGSVTTVERSARSIPANSAFRGLVALVADVLEASSADNVATTLAGTKYGRLSGHASTSISISRMRMTSHRRHI